MTGRWLTLGTLLCLPLAAMADEAAKETPPPAFTYGFKEPEIYKLDFRLANLLARDIDGDGKLDLIVVNNLKNRIDVLAQRSKNPPVDKPRAKVNDIPYDSRLEHRKIPLKRGVSSLEVKDVNGDTKADLVYLGDPAGLYIEYQQPDATFGQERIFENADAQQATWTIDVGDLNGDGRDDIAHLGMKYLYLLMQDEQGRLSSPRRLRLGDDRTGLLRILDIDEDGHNDIVYFATASDLPVRLRLQEADSAYGPERRLRIDPPRGVSFANVNNKPGQELLTISSLTDRFVIHAFEKTKPSDESPTSQIVIFPFESAGTGKQADLVVADFDGDKRIDVAASDAESSHLQFFPQVRTVTTFPCMLGTELLRSADVNGDGKSVLISLSSKDKSIAVSEFADGRFSFPQAIVTEGEPMVMDVVGGGAGSRILYIAKETKDGKSTYKLRRLKPKDDASDAAWVADAVGQEGGLSIELATKPSDMRSADVNGDGKQDFLVFIPFKPPTILLGQDGDTYRIASDTSKGILGNLTPGNFYFGPLESDKPVFLASLESFARRLTMEDGDRWKVLDQYNATTGSAKVNGSIAIDLIGDPTRELVMYDRGSQSLVFLRSESGVYRSWQTLKVGNFDVRGMRSGDFNGDGTIDLLLYDGEKLGIVYTRGDDLRLQPLASYETDNKDGQLFDMVPGDLNGDDKLDFLLLDPMDHNIEIVSWNGENKLEKALRWQVFEVKTFEEESNQIEPREALVADLDADGLQDIALVVHDRILVYLQDDGAPDSPTAVQAEKK